MDPHSANIPALSLPEPPAKHGTASNVDTHGQGPTSLSPATVDEGSSQLDQEWVNKAKAIVEKTKSDPFSESQELSRMKADYLKTRYNKDIKVSEDNA